MQQIYRRTPMRKCDFNKVALQDTFLYEQLWTALESYLSVENHEQMFVFFLLALKILTT